jgi:hypothetical protein
MTQHELLAFVDGLRRHVETEISNPGPWCWPTRELLVENLKANAKLWGPGLISGEFPDTLRTLKAKEWAAEAPCSPNCHANHVSLTEAGLEALRLMDERGCAGHIHVKRRERCHAKFRFRRKRAA